MKTLSRTEIFNASPKQVFDVMDDLGVTGAHMTTTPMMMMGSKLNLEFLTPFRKGLGTRYRWSGKMMGLKMDFTLEVTKWKDGIEKVWGTVGEPKLIIYSGFGMSLNVEPKANQTKADLAISYEKPKSFVERILCFFFADWYCNWCLKKMLNDARKMLEAK